MLKGRVHVDVNSKALEKEILNSIPRLNTRNTIASSIKTSSGKILLNEIKQIKKDMMFDFLNHPITVEILAGPRAYNSSGTLGGYGNLFSFIGFNENDKPIDPILKLLNQTNYNISPFINGSSQIKFEMPSAEDIFKVTPLPWATGISWAQRIEVGLSGLGSYINKSSDISRSGEGLQSKKKQKGGAFRNTPYISSFINKWKIKFEKLAKGSF